MKYLLVFLVAGSVYVGFFRKSPDAPAAKPSNEPRAAASVNVGASLPQPASSNVLKRPLDRTHQVLDQVGNQRDGNAGGW